MRAKAVLSAVLAAWLIPPLVVGAVLAHVPNVMLGEGDAGAFISAWTHLGGLASPDITTLQTTRGTFIVSDLVTVLRGESLVVVDSTVHGMQLCDQRTMTRCSQLVGTYVGVLRRLPHGTVWLTFAWRKWIGFSAIAWFIIGIPVFFGTVVTLIDDSKADDGGDDDDDGTACGHGSERGE